MSTVNADKEEVMVERKPLPKDAEGSAAYVIADNIGLIMQKLETVPDIATGGMRAKRYGAWIGMHIVPNLDKATNTDGPVILPAPPSIFIDADSLDQLRARLVYEVETIVDNAKQLRERTDELGGKPKEN